MNKKMLIVACLLVGFCCSNVFALNLMGPPNAELSEGQLGYGVEYSLSELAMDFDFSSGPVVMADFSRDEMEVDSLSGRLGYGVSDNIEGFFRIGMADIYSDERGTKYDGDGTFYGFGAKVTLKEEEKITWGLQVQANMADTDGDWSANDGSWTGDSTVEFMEIVVAVGPNYQLNDTTSIYGGPFWYMLDGEKTYTAPGEYERYDVENQSSFGGFVGLQIDVPTDAKLNLEYQLTGDDNIMGLNLIWRH